METPAETSSKEVELRDIRNDRGDVTIKCARYTLGGPSVTFSPDGNQWYTVSRLTSIKHRSRREVGEPFEEFQGCIVDSTLTDKGRITFYVSDFGEGHAIVGLEEFGSRWTITGELMVEEALTHSRGDIRRAALEGSKSFIVTEREYVENLLTIMEEQNE